MLHSHPTKGSLLLRIVKHCSQVERREDAKPGLDVDEPGVDARPAPGLDGRDLDGSAGSLPGKCHGIAYGPYNVMARLHHILGINGR